MSFHDGAPVVVIAFNRPQYIERVLASLKNQVGESISDEQIHFFQDGAINPISGERYAEDADLEIGAELFRRYFPNGALHRSDHNLGVALNFERAERFVFEEHEASVAYFFEDDLELGPAYLATLRRLANIALARDDVGYFAAYGSPFKTVSEQEAVANQVQHLGHHWAFGLTRKQWLKSRPIVNQYLDLVRSIDYRQRRTADVAALLKSWGVGVPGTSQDVVKSLACFLTGSIKINTRAAFGRYIGELGLHSTPEIFEKMGFREVAYLSDDIFRRDGLREEEVETIKGVMKNYALHDITKPRKDAEEIKEARSAMISSPLMSEDEIACFRSFVEGVNHLLEYGSGWSTIFAAQHGASKITTIESDPRWADAVVESAKSVKSIVDIRRVDLGPVGEWGKPLDTSTIRAWPGYWQTPWPLSGIDIVVVDGRFRIACALNSAINTTPGTPIIVRDFWNRPHYHGLLEHLIPIDLHP